MRSSDTKLWFFVVNTFQFKRAASLPDTVSSASVADLKETNTKNSHCRQELNLHRKNIYDVNWRDLHEIWFLNLADMTEHQSHWMLNISLEEEEDIFVERAIERINNFHFHQYCPSTRCRRHSTAEYIHSRVVKAVRLFRWKRLKG